MSPTSVANRARKPAGGALLGLLSLACLPDPADLRSGVGPGAGSGGNAGSAGGVPGAVDAASGGGQPAGGDGPRATSGGPSGAGGGPATFDAPAAATPDARPPPSPDGPGMPVNAVCASFGNALCRRY
jgi:hypothetical protein